MDIIALPLLAGFLVAMYLWAASTGFGRTLEDESLEIIEEALEPKGKSKARPGKQA